MGPSEKPGYYEEFASCPCQKTKMNLYHAYVLSVDTSFQREQTSTPNYFSKLFVAVVIFETGSLDVSLSEL